MDNDKELLRIWLKKKRLAMEPAEVDRLSALICKKLIKDVNWQNIKSVHCYTAIKSLKEVDTAMIFEFIETEHPGIKVFEQGKDSILPFKGNRFDLIIVPTLGFDSRLNRMGWGGGFYDRFLASQPQALKAGLCFESGFVKKGLPVESYDVPLNMVVTEKRLLKI
jgi:5-formyltetrahydrofolate cyclo-ligase